MLRGCRASDSPFPRKKASEVNDNARFLLQAIYVKNNEQQPNYTADEREYRVVLPLDLRMHIPGDDAMCVMLEITQRLDCSKLYRTHQRPSHRNDKATTPC